MIQRDDLFVQLSTLAVLCQSVAILPKFLCSPVSTSGSCLAPRPAMEALARIGTSGDFSANAHRYLRRKLNLGNLDLNIPPPLLTDIPLRVAKQRGGLKTMVTEELRYPVMLPREFLAVMYLQHRSEFDAFILGPQPHSCRQSSIRGTPSQAH